MKKCVWFAAFVAIAGYGDAQPRSTLHAWRATIKVVDDSGQPVSGAETWVSYSLPVLNDQSKDWGKISGVSDANGVFIASHVDQTVAIGFHAQKPGYYWTAASHEFGFDADNPRANWNPVQTLVLVKIGKPIAMYAKREEAKMPREDSPVGFDLAAGDWISPFGTGRQADLFLTVHRKIISAKEYDADMRLSFPNSGDGIVAVPPGPDAYIAMLRSAVTNGYVSARTWRYHNSSASPEAPYGYFFRVRTVLDANGNVSTALYGKIKGDVRFYAGTKSPHAGLGFDYYLNPNANSLNMEFDPKQNMIQHLGPGESLTQP